MEYGMIKAARIVTLLPIQANSESLYSVNCWETFLDKYKHYSSLMNTIIHGKNPSLTIFYHRTFQIFPIMHFKMGAFEPPTFDKIIAHIPCLDINVLVLV